MMTSDQQMPPVRDRSQLHSAAKIVVFDIAGPLWRTPCCVRLA